MRFAVVLVLLAACDLQPGGKKAPGSGSGVAPAAPTQPAPPDAGVVAVPNDGGGAQRSVDAMENSDECVTMADHIAELVIAGITDETQKAQQVQDRARTVRRIAETCTRDKWNEAARKCFMDAKTAQELQPCGAALAAPKPE